MQNWKTWLHKVWEETSGELSIVDVLLSGWEGEVMDKRINRTQPAGDCALASGCGQSDVPEGQV